jgi:hypothetical protein
MLAILGDHRNIKVVLLRSDEKQDLVDALLNLDLMMKEVLLLLRLLLVHGYLVEDKINLHL